MKMFTLLASLFLVQNLHASEVISLDEFMKRVERDNLQIKSEKLATEGLEAGSSSISLPPPMVSYIQMKESGAKGFEVTQTVPFPTKISNEQTLRKREFRAQAQKEMVLRQEILQEARLSYFSLWKSQELLKLLNEKKEIFTEHLNLAQSRVRSDSFLKIHYLRMESDLDLLENTILEEKQKETEAQSLFAQWLGLDSSQVFVAKDPPMNSPIPRVAPEQSLQVKFGEAETDVFRSQKSLAKNSWFPDFNFKYRAVEKSSMSPENTEWMVGITLPFLFFWQPDIETQRARLKLTNAELGLERTKREVSIRLSALTSKLTSLERQIETLTKKLIPNAEKRIRLIHNIAPRDMETLLDHRETMLALPELKMNLLEKRFEYEETVSQINKNFKD